jgi:UDP:flavonoid glycosyltransferase YjiC (YdhE family)
VLAYLSSGIGSELARAAPAHVRYVDAPIDMTEAARGCDFAVSHAGHGTTSAMLLAGKPLLQIPFQVEQACLARRVGDLGAGLTAAPDRPEAICAGFDTLLADPRFAEGARAFAARHASFDPDRALAGVVGRIEGLLRRGPIS